MDEQGLIVSEATTHELVIELIRRCGCMAIAYRVPEDEVCHYRWTNNPTGKAHESLGMAKILMGVIEDSFFDEDNHADAPCY